MTVTKSSDKALALRSPFLPILATALFLSACSDSEQQQVNVCDAAVKNAQSLKNDVFGDVAAFLVAERPQSLSEISFKDEKGATKTIADFKGQTVFVNLWATWCAPCRAEMPSIEHMTTALSSDKFAVVPISVDLGDANKPKNFYQEIGLSKLPFYHDGTMETFNIAKKKSLALGLPASILLDKNNCVLGRLNGPAEWDSETAKNLIKAAIALD